MKLSHIIAGAVLMLAATCWPAMRAGLTPDPNTYLVDVIKQMHVAWPRNRTITLVFHGHSVPAGYFRTPVVNTFNAYPHLLHRVLKERYPNAVINVIVTAIGGENSEAGAKRFEKDVLSLHPDVVMIDYGINDRRLTARESSNAWSSMINKAKEANVPVILLTPTGVEGVDPRDSQDSLFKQAQQIRRLAFMNEVGLADSYQAFARYIRSGGKMEDLLSQINHPNRKGHELVAAELAKWFGRGEAPAEPAQEESQPAAPQESEQPSADPNQ
ncbi:MAG: SGNH/GDSL hydrolase family protein [Planctomycetaceae bacterium]|nr:SGNH/GDSL hydrolase family protein [Planctomycetaceae bacterium]